MANKIILKKSSVSGKIPQPTDLDFGELALNYSDGKLYYKKADTTIGAIEGGAPVGAIVGTTDAQTLTNKTIAYSNNTLTGVQPTLVSGTNIKTINDTSLLGSGNISIATDISITHNNNSVIVNSSDGTDGTINAATTTDAGVMSALDKTKLDGIATGAEVNVNADWNAVSGDAQILNKPTLGTAAAANTTDFATAAQGAKADTALQPAAIGVSLQAYDADLTSIAGLTGTSGLLKKTAANTWSLDTNVYLTSYTETDPVFSASAASGITTTNISNWNTAYGWGNHASAGYLTSAAIGTTVQAYDADLTSWAGIAPTAKQDTLVSGTSIKTINSQSLLGSGDIVISGGGSSALTIDNKTAAYTVVASDLGKIINCTSGGLIVSLTAAATLGAGFNCWIWNTSNSVVTIDPSGTETIDGISTIDLRQGEGTQIVCTGSNWLTGDKKTMRGYAENFPTGTGRPTASGVYAVAIGRAAQATNNGSVAIGPFANSYSTSSVAIGQDALASSNYAVAIGLNSSGTASQAVTGAGAMALGGSYASGTDSFAAAIANNTSSYGARGANSVAIGYLAQATNTKGLALGAAAIASGSNSIAISNQYSSGSTASGSGAIAIGTQVTASGAASFAYGMQAIAGFSGKLAYASGSILSDGDAQTGTMVLRRVTTDATATVLTSNNLAAGATNQVILPNDSTYAFSILVVARRTDADNESAGYKFEGVVDRNGSAATTAIVGTVAKTVLAEDTAAWDVNVTADTTNGGLAITVTGEAGKTIRWVATVWTSEVTG